MTYYKVVAHIRVDAEEDQYTYYTSVEDAQDEVNHCESMQPENIYVIEKVHKDELPENPDIYEAS